MPIIIIIPFFIIIYYIFIFILIVIDLMEISIYPFFETKKQVLFALFPFIYIITMIFKFVKNWWNELP